MDTRMNDVLNRIGDKYRTRIMKGARHYLEVSIGEQAGHLGYRDLGARYRDTFAIVPLKSPQDGMKVRIDGRTFVNYREHENGIAVPGFVTGAAGSEFSTFVPNDSMICNFT